MKQDQQEVGNPQYQLYHRKISQRNPLTQEVNMLMANLTEINLTNLRVIILDLSYNGMTNKLLLFLHKEHLSRDKIPISNTLKDKKNQLRLRLLSPVNQMQIHHHQTFHSLQDLSSNLKVMLLFLQELKLKTCHFKRNQM